MVTKTGLQSDFLEALQDLIELEYAAIAAYDTAIENFEKNEYKEKFNEFRKDHKRHLKEFSDFLRNEDYDPPKSAGPKQLLTKGKTALASIIGDKAILQAMLSNEEDTNTAYARMAERNDLLRGTVTLIEKAFSDERRHKSWIEKELKNL